MTELEVINKKLTELNDELVNYAKSLNFKIVCEFDLENCESIPWNEIHSKGIYFIEIKNKTNFNDFQSWIKTFREEWEDEKYKYRFVPNIKNKRINKHNELKDWIPLYIGKSKKISTRIHQHIFKEIEKTTFALKLNAREHAKKETFRLSIIEIPTNNYDWIVPVLEKTLRDQINPIIGKQ